MASFVDVHSTFHLDVTASFCRDEYVEINWDNLHESKLYLLAKSWYIIPDETLQSESYWIVARSLERDAAELEISKVHRHFLKPYISL